MDFRELDLFCHLARSLHFGKTASAKFVSPSTLSRVISRLEETTNTTLFERNNRHVELTPNGEIFFVFASSVLQQWSETQQSLKERSENLSGTIKLFCSVTASQSHLPQLLDRFRKNFSMVDIRLETGDPGIALTKVLEEQCDLAIAINIPDMPPELGIRPFAQVPLVLIAPREWGLNSLQDVQWQETPVVMPESGPTRRTVHHWFAEEGIRPMIYASVGGNEAIVSMVALGCGVGFVPDVVLAHSTMSSQVTRISVNNIEPYELGLCYLKRRGQEPIIQAMLQHVDS